MAITRVDFPTAGGAANFPDDYNKQNSYLSGLAIGLGQSLPRSIFDNIGSDTLPNICIGAYIQHGGIFYVVDSEDYVITGSIVVGKNYISVRPAVGGATLTAVWVQSDSGYTYNNAYNGWYDANGYQLLKEYVYYNGSDYFKFISQTEGHNAYFKKKIVSRTGFVSDLFWATTNGSTLDTGAGCGAVPSGSQARFVGFWDVTQFSTVPTPGANNNWLMTLSGAAGFGIVDFWVYGVPVGVSYLNKNYNDASFTLLYNDPTNYSATHQYSVPLSGIDFSLYDYIFAYSQNGSGSTASFSMTTSGLSNMAFDSERGIFLDYDLGYNLRGASAYTGTTQITAAITAWRDYAISAPIGDDW